MKNLLLAILAATRIYAQSAKVFFEQLPNSPLPSHEQLLAATDQIPKLSKADALVLLPVVLTDIKYDSDVGLDAALALYTFSLRPDSGELLTPHIQDLAALYGRSDSRYKATANIIFATLKSRTIQAVPILAAFIMGPSGTGAEKADSLTVLMDIAGTAPEAEPAALHVLNMQLTPGARHAALLAAARPGATNKVIDVIAGNLTDTNETVQIGAIQALAMLGRAVVAQHTGDLAKVVLNSSNPATARRLAQDVIDGKDMRCTTLQGQPIKPCN